MRSAGLADQAAGLRRRSAQQPLRCLHCFFDVPASSIRLAQALHQLEQASLLVDMRGRLFADAPTRSLFDCKQQLQRGALYTLPHAYGDGWYAPGIRADEPGLRGAAHGYDCVVFDAGPIRTGLALMPGALNSVIIEVQPASESMLRAYALLKTLAAADDKPGIVLLGDPLACDHVRTACKQFLAHSFTQAICNMANEGDAIAALAIRIVGETGGEENLTARTITGTNLKHGR